MSVNRFRGEYFFLSNMYPCRVKLDGVYYPSVENAYQVSKTEDVELRKLFQGYTPRRSKKMGRTLVIREDWIGKQLSIMEMLVRQKFVSYPDLGWALTQIEGRIEDGNTWGDKFWGVCDGEGENHLGYILMDVRQDIISGDPSGLECLHHDHG